MTTLGLDRLRFWNRITDPTNVPDLIGSGSAALPISFNILVFFAALQHPRTILQSLLCCRLITFCHVFQHFLCEDRSTATDTNFSYVDFLCHMHKEIRAILS
jgi:hypothetical protein